MIKRLFFLAFGIALSTLGAIFAVTLGFILWVVSYVGVR